MFKFRRDVRDMFPFSGVLILSDSTLSTGENFRAGRQIANSQIAENERN